MLSIRTIPFLLLLISPSALSDQGPCPPYDASALMKIYGYPEDKAQKFSSLLDNLLHIDRHKDALPKIKKMGPDFCRVLIDQATGTSPRKGIRLYALGQALSRCTDKTSLTMLSDFIVNETGDRNLKRELITALAENSSPSALATLNDVINQLFLDWLESEGDTPVEKDFTHSPFQGALWSLAHTESDKLLPSIKRLAKDALSERVEFTESILEAIITILGNTRSKASLKLLKDFVISPFSNIYPGTLAEALIHNEQTELAHSLTTTFRNLCKAEPDKTVCEHQLRKIEWVESQIETQPEPENDIPEQ